MISLFTLLISTMALSYVPVIQDEQVEEIVYFYAEPPDNYGSADNLNHSSWKRTKRFMLVSPPTKRINIWKTIRMVFPPIDLSERG